MRDIPIKTAANGKGARDERLSATLKITTAPDPTMIVKLAITQEKASTKKVTFRSSFRVRGVLVLVLVLVIVLVPVGEVIVDTDNRLLTAKAFYEMKIDPSGDSHLLNRFLGTSTGDGWQQNCSG